MTPTPEERTPDELTEWDEWVTLHVHVHVTARPNPNYFEGWRGRKPSDLAITAVLTGRSDPAQLDGFADLIGDADVRTVEEF